MTDTLESIVAQATRLRNTAHTAPIGKRQASFVLYSMLGECMDLALRCRREPGAAALLRLKFAEQDLRGRNRRYVERGSDEFTLVCRYVFPTGSRAAERANASRYAHTLRQADQRGIEPTGLAAWLGQNGGVNALFLARPLDRNTVRTKTLYLDRQIEIGKDATFTLTLRRRVDNCFEVVAGPITEPVHD